MYWECWDREMSHLHNQYWACSERLNYSSSNNQNRGDSILEELYDVQTCLKLNLYVPLPWHCHSLMRRDRTQFFPIKSEPFSRRTFAAISVLLLSIDFIAYRGNRNWTTRTKPPCKTNSRQIDRNHVCSHTVQVPCKKIKASRKQTVVKLTSSKPSVV